MLRLVVFDLAGTTVIDDGQVPKAFREALAQHGVMVDDEAIAGVRGASKRQAIAALLGVAADDPRVAAMAATFRMILARYYRAAVRPVPGARELFDELRRAGVRIALNTGFERETTALLLECLGWETSAVDAVICGDEVAVGRPAPDLILAAMARTGVVDPSMVMNVGDTRLDLLAGHAAGVRWNVGVLNGAHGRDLLQTAPHTHLVPSIADLPAAWLRT